MQKTISLRLSPGDAATNSAITEAIAVHLSVPARQITGFTRLKQSLDARARTIWVNLTVLAYINEPPQSRLLPEFHFKSVHNAKNRVLIAGAGPAGLFAALKLLELGIQPIVLERGKEVRARRRDLAAMNKQGIVNPDSNYCFGEGGAGTYSDGKLYTRSNKRGDVQRMLAFLHHFGAEDHILYQAHPHIGTNKLPGIISAIRETIIAAGGEYHFGKKLSGLDIKQGRLQSIACADGDKIDAQALILATGHSARDIFELLHANHILVEAKPFALGVRIEHPQSLIDNIQYHCATRDHHLPPAAYSLVDQVDGRGVFSFCMCPGGIIAPAATSPGEIVVNGWSPSKRNNPFANSGMVVSIEEKDFRIFQKEGPLAALRFQQSVEQSAFLAGGGNLAAPAQRMTDFVNNKSTAQLPACSYIPGIHAVQLKEVLPDFVHRSLQKAFVEFGKKMKGYYTNEAVVVATESRSSSPVRIPRDEKTLQHPQISNLYPCGEGAGYAGGIISAAMDGYKVAATCAEQFATG